MPRFIYVGIRINRTFSVSADRLSLNATFYNYVHKIVTAVFDYMG